MLTIRLKRMGQKKQPEYRMVVTEKTTSVKGSYIERVGHFNPRSGELLLDKEKIEKWLSQGASPSNTVAKLLEKEKIKLPKWVKIKKYPERPSRAELKKKDAAPEQAAKPDEAGTKKEEAAAVVVEETVAEKPVETPVAEVTPSESEASAETEEKAKE